jgi:PAS domain S-box-containing protein
VVPDLKAIGGDMESAIERINVPAYVIDRHGIISWINPAAEKIVGNVRGLQLTSVLPPDERRRGREIFTRNLHGPPGGSDNSGVVMSVDGERIEVDVSAVPLKNGDHVVGVFGQVKGVGEKPSALPHPSLTQRQNEVLRLLEHGRSTKQIANELHLSMDTVRTHIRHLLRKLGVHSRLEAVAFARRNELVTS